MQPSPSIQTFRVPRSQQGTRLVSFLADQLKISGSKAKTLLDQRAVWVNGKRVWMARHALSASDVVEVRGSQPAVTPEAPLELLFENDDLLAVNKPAGHISESHQDSVESRLRREYAMPTLRALHRLDRDTSGVLLFLKDPSVRETYVELFRDHRIEKEYAVLLAGSLPGNPVEITKRLEGKSAHSLFVAKASSPGFCRAACFIQTGRMHQIRKHAQSLGCRVLGDSQYRAGPDITPREKKIVRHMLHAERIAFPSPHREDVLEIKAPWPADFQHTATLFHLI